MNLCLRNSPYSHKLSRRSYASVSYALQNNTVFKRAQNWVSLSDGSRTDNGSEFQSVDIYNIAMTIILHVSVVRNKR